MPSIKATVNSIEGIKLKKLKSPDTFILYTINIELMFKTSKNAK